MNVSNIAKEIRYKAYMERLTLNPSDRERAENDS